MSNRNRKYSDEWYDPEMRNPFVLKEYWYQKYVAEHPQEFGFTKLEGPFNTGADFIAVEGRRRLTVEVERDYLSYLRHEHPKYDVLIVAVLAPPHPAMRRFLPRVIKNLDPQKVLDWSQPFRADYRKKKEEFRRIQQEIANKIANLPTPCPDCGADLEELEQDMSSMSDAETMDYFAGFNTPFYCYSCDDIKLLDTDVPDQW